MGMSTIASGYASLAMAAESGCEPTKLAAKTVLVLLQRYLGNHIFRLTAADLASQRCCDRPESAAGGKRFADGGGVAGGRDQQV